MEYTLEDALGRAFSDNTYRCVISNASGSEYRRIEISLLNGRYQIERFTKTQAFHESLTPDAAQKLAAELLRTSHKSFVSWDGEFEYTIRISKKGKVLYSKRRSDGAPERRVSHNRQKSYILPEGEAVEPLIDMGVFTADGKVRADMQAKYRQINRFVEIIDDDIRKTDKKSLRILDFGCGKSYLTFVIYHYLTKIREIDINMTGLDLKSEVIEKCNAAAKKYGYGGLRFEVGDIADYKTAMPPDIVISLHACDIATDFALFNAISWGAEMIFAVPCCQRELNSQMKPESLAILARYGIAKERFASLLTDSIRANLLECAGYSTQMIEFTAFEHTPKNIMLRAVKKPGRDKTAALSEVESAIREFKVLPTLYRLMKDMI